MSITEDSRLTRQETTPRVATSAGLNSPQVKSVTVSMSSSPAGTEDSRPAIQESVPMGSAPAGADPLGGQELDGAQYCFAAEGQDSPHANVVTVPMDVPHAGSQASRSHESTDAHPFGAAADNFPGGQNFGGPQKLAAAGELVPSAARDNTVPIVHSPLADPLLALAADVLGDLEKVRVANENRLRQLTRSEEDSDGETRGFGLDESHPDVARLAALVQMLADAEHKATLNLQRLMRQHPLGPWVAAQKGVGEKQAARLLAAIGDPYLRPEITLADGTADPARPRTVSELWAYCGLAPGQKRRRGERANWSAAAKMRAWNIAGSMLKAGNREAYDKRKAVTEGRMHAAECVRCGPAGHPAQPGTPWSDGHRHADALRVMSKELLKELWREARRIHLELPVGGQQ